jgi:hypothetical protein
LTVLEDEGVELSEEVTVVVCDGWLLLFRKPKT